MKHHHSTIVGLLGSGMISLALLCILFFVWMRIRTNEQVVQLLQEKIAIEEQQSTEFTTLTKTIKATEAQNAQLATYVLTPEDVVPFLTTLEQVGVTTNTEVTLTDVAVEPKKDAIPPHLDVRLQAVGSFENVYRALRTFETLPYEHTITEVLLVANDIPKNTTNQKTPVLGEQSWKLSLAVTITSVQF